MQDIKGYKLLFLTKQLRYGCRDNVFFWGGTIQVVHVRDAMKHWCCISTLEEIDERNVDLLKDPQVVLLLLHEHCVRPWELASSLQMHQHAISKSQQYLLS